MILIKPLHDYYLIKLIEPEEKTTDAGVILPESIQKKMPTVMGIVMGAPRVLPSGATVVPHIGATVIIKPDAAVMHEAVDMGDEGKFFLVKLENIIATVVDKDEE